MFLPLPYLVASQPAGLSLTRSKEQQGPLAGGWAGWGERGLFVSGFGWRGARPGPHLETLIGVNLRDGDVHGAEPGWPDRRGGGLQVQPAPPPPSPSHPAGAQQDRTKRVEGAQQSMGACWAQVRPLRTAVGQHFTR